MGATRSVFQDALALSRQRQPLTTISFQAARYGFTWAGLAPADRASFAWRLHSFDHLVGEQKERSGIVSPSAFAVLRLTVRSNLVGCCRGRYRDRCQWIF